MARAKKAAPIEEGDTEETAVKKVSPKSAKKSTEPGAPKSSKKSKPAAEDDGASDSSESMVTLASLCESRDLNPRDARIRLRRKLEDDPEQPRYILTERGTGYRFRPAA